MTRASHRRFEEAQGGVEAQASLSISIFREMGALNYFGFLSLSVLSPGYGSCRWTSGGIVKAEEG